jgi:hypothetical protein
MLVALAIKIFPKENGNCSTHRLPQLMKNAKDADFRRADIPSKY